MKSKQSKGIVLNTQGFGLADIKRVCEFFEKK